MGKEGDTTPQQYDTGFFNSKLLIFHRKTIIFCVVFTCVVVVVSDIVLKIKYNINQVSK